MGGCSSKQSGEHYVTKGLFEGDSLKVKGLPWCKFEEKTIGLGSATANILCKALLASIRNRGYSVKFTGQTAP